MFAETTIRITKLKKTGTTYTASVVSVEHDEIKLLPEVVATYQIKADCTFTESLWHEILQENMYKQCYKKALDLLTRRLHSERELATKLKMKCFDRQIINRVIEECKNFNFIDDVRFAELYVSELQCKGYGPARIRQQLYKKQLPKELIDQVIDQNTNPESDLQTLQQLAERKLRSLKREKDLRKKKEKLFRHLLAKGFSYDLINQVVNKLDL